jgi:hypothetical protein
LRGIAHRISFPGLLLIVVSSFFELDSRAIRQLRDRLKQFRAGCHSKAGMGN